MRNGLRIVYIVLGPKWKGRPALNAKWHIYNRYQLRVIRTILGVRVENAPNQVVKVFQGQ